MATHSTITDLLPVQSQLDYALEDAISPEEQMELVLQYLEKIDDSEKDLTIPDFEEGECSEAGRAAQEAALTCCRFTASE